MPGQHPPAEKKKQKTHLPQGASSPADSFGFSCLGFEVSEISVTTGYNGSESNVLYVAVKALKEVT